ncbi:hypothetical protein S245_056305 [Arachis hypogaea]|nr:Pentatricopeptide repeat-containing protein [Arachis hypogaea]
MERYGIEIGIRYYGCMVDLLGRAGRLKKVKRMPMKSNEAVFGALVGACQIHSDVQIAEQVMKLIGASTVSSSDSLNVLLFNTYAASEKWEKCEQMRRIRVHT